MPAAQHHPPGFGERCDERRTPSTRRTCDRDRCLRARRSDAERRSGHIAKVIGADTTLPDALVQGIWDEVSPHAEEWRSIGVFPAAVAVADDAPLQDRLLGLTGRQPDTH